MEELRRWSRFARQFAAAPPLSFIGGAHHDVHRHDYCKMHSHRDIEIVFHPRGVGVTTTNTQRNVSFREGSVVLYAPDEKHDQRMTLDGEDMCIYLGVTDALRSVPSTGLYVPEIDDPVLVEEMRTLSQQRSRLDAAEQAVYNFRGTATLLSLIRIACARHDQRKATPAEQRVFVAEQYMRENFPVIRSVQEVADHVGISHDFLRHTFKALRKKTIIRHLNEVRIDRAKSLLSHTRLSLKQVAPMCGFADEYYFSTVFKKLTDTVPGAYRKRQKS